MVSDYLILTGRPLLFPNGPVMHFEADLTISHKAVVASVPSAAILYYSYGPAIPYKGGPIITKRVGPGSADAAAVAWSEPSTSPINTLNPLRQYRIHGGGACPEDAYASTTGVIAMRLSANSFGGRKIILPGCFSFHMDQFVFFDGIHGPNDSLVVQGWDNLTIEYFVAAVEKPVGYVFFEDYGPAQTMPTGGQTGIAGGATSSAGLKQNIAIGGKTGTVLMNTILGKGPRRR